MASALFNRLSKSIHSSTSAGYDVGERVGNPVHEYVILCMLEKGHDLTRCVRQQITPEFVRQSDKIIAMGDRSEMSDYLLSSPNVEFWEVEDPKGESLEFHGTIRDMLENKVRGLIKRLS